MSVATTTQNAAMKADDLADTGEALVKGAQKEAEERTDEHIDREQSRSHNIVGAAVTLGLSVIMLILMAIVAGYFVTQAPSDGAFSEARTSAVRR
jgi:hypothetical protein